MPKQNKRFIELENSDVYDDEKGFFRSAWRPLIAYSYVAINLFDFIIAPISRMVYATVNNIDLLPWESLTTSNGGVFHLAMGGILGAAAWTRGHENIERVRRRRPVHTPYEGDVPAEDNPTPPYDLGN